MNRSQIRDLARSITELEVDDVSDEVLDAYIQDGFARIVALERRWPSYETSTTLTTTASQRDYALSAIGDGDLREIISIVRDQTGGRLDLVSYDYAEGLFLTGSDYSAPPTMFSTWGGDIQLWPKPDTIYSLRVRGYRKPTTWYLGDSDEVDADERLHQALIYYAVASMYQLQEDTELSQMYRNTFDEAVRLAHGDIMRMPSHQPLILSGGGRRRRFSGPLRDGHWWAQ